MSFIIVLVTWAVVLFLFLAVKWSRARRQRDEHEQYEQHIRQFNRAVASRFAELRDAQILKNQYVYLDTYRTRNVIVDKMPEPGDGTKWTPLVGLWFDESGNLNLDSIRSVMVPDKNGSWTHVESK